MSAITAKSPSHKILVDDLFTTPVIVEDLVNRFKYWNKTIQEGIQYQGDLYAQVRTYLATDRMQAFSDSHEYAATGNKVCITASKEKYTLWVDLRSYAASA